MTQSSPSRLSTQSLLLCADYRTLVLRDVYCDEQDLSLLSVASENVAACGGYQVFIITTQDSIRVRATAEVWDSAPQDDPSTGGWTGPLLFELDCPTGQLILGDQFGTVITIEPAAGAGTYAVAVYHQGRERGAKAFRDWLNVLNEPGGDELSDEIARQNAGAEQYLVRLWWTAESPEEEEEEDTEVF